MSDLRSWLQGRALTGLGSTLSILLALAGCSDDGGNGTPAIDASLPDGMTPDAMLPDAMLPDAMMMPDAMPVAPAFRTQLLLGDDIIATASLQLMGSPAVGADPNCNDCHALTRQSLRYWRALSDEAMRTCLTDLAIETPESARTMIDCLRDDPGDPMGNFQPKKLGIFTTGVDNEWFEYLFWRAYGEPTWQAEYEAFKMRMIMPQVTSGHAAFSQNDFDIVAEWFARGLPALDATLPEDPPPSECLPGVSADVDYHVSAMELVGWKAKNEENNILMFGCNGANSAIECLTSYHDADSTPYGAGWEIVPDSTQRILFTTSYRSSYWTRSSADGRFVGHGRTGAGTAAAIVDLQREFEIPVSAFYDPGFFPDNSGFMFQAGSALFCEQSELTASPMQITFSEPTCTSNNAVGLYQHIAAAVDGGDYWAVDGQFVSDNGGITPTLSDPPSFFGSNSRIDLTPIVNVGNGYEPQLSIRLDVPFEGDTVLSPSGRLMVSRVGGPGNAQLGYLLRDVQAIMLTGGGGYTVQSQEVARYCINGGKPGFSYDERWMVIHHYIDAGDAVELGFTDSDDPGFQPYLSQGGANLYLIDLLTGQSTRITHMAPGQYALFPHFRSDGWIYYQVRIIGQTGEHIVANDAALVLSTP